LPEGHALLALTARFWQTWKHACQNTFKRPTPYTKILTLLSSSCALRKQEGSFLCIVKVDEMNRFATYRYLECMKLKQIRKIWTHMQ